MTEINKTLAGIKIPKKDRVKECGVYKLTDKSTKEFYIGSSGDLEARLRGHYLDVVGNKSAYFIDCAANEIEIEILHTCDLIEDAREAEKHFIKIMRPHLNTQYNLRFPKRTKRKIRTIVKRKVCFLKFEFSNRNK